MTLAIQKVARATSGSMDLESRSRKELQALAKQHGIKANSKTAELVQLLTAALHSSTTTHSDDDESMVEGGPEVEMAQQPEPPTQRDASYESDASVNAPTPPAKAESKPVSVTWSVLGKRLPPAPAVKAVAKAARPSPSNPSVALPSPSVQPATVPLPPPQTTAPTTAITEPPLPPGSSKIVPEHDDVQAKLAAAKSGRATSEKKRPVWQMTPFVPQKSGRKPTAHESVPACAEKSGSRSFEVKSLDAAKKAREEHRARDERSAALKKSAKKRRDEAIAKLHAAPLHSYEAVQPLAVKVLAQVQAKTKKRVSRSDPFNKPLEHSNSLSSVVMVARV
eukprot:scaffold6886_cov118-Isochrysis_galbana.AAC.3